jgi:hypothetical protein
MMQMSPPDAFDGAAAIYDSGFESLPGTPRLRRLIQTHLLGAFHHGDSILELNAGTGTDAIFLAAHGISVHATDGSPAMVREIERKVEARSFGNRITTGILDIRNVGQLRGRMFDGLLSNLGGMNCIRETRPLLQSIPALLRPGAHAVLCFMPDQSLWETVAFGLKAQWRQARRRSNPEGCLAEIAGSTVRTFYHSPPAIVQEAAPAFVHLATVGLNIITPPPSSVAAHRMLRPVLPLLERLEDLVSSVPPLNRMGDHALVILRRVP